MRVRGRNDSPLLRLHDRITRAIEHGGGLKLSLEDIDLLVSAGVYDKISEALAAEFKEQALARIESRRGNGE